jgi:hypothetical protein
MQTGSSGTLIFWKSGQTTYVPLWDRMEGAWPWTLRWIALENNALSSEPVSGGIRNHLFKDDSALFTRFLHVFGDKRNMSLQKL